MSDAVLPRYPFSGIVERRKGKLVLDLFKLRIRQGLTVKCRLIAAFENSSQIRP